MWYAESKYCQKSKPTDIAVEKTQTGTQKHVCLVQNITMAVFVVLYVVRIYSKLYVVTKLAFLSHVHVNIVTDIRNFTFLDSLLETILINYKFDYTINKIVISGLKCITVFSYNKEQELYSS